MLVVYLGLILGLILIVYGVLSYTGSSVFAGMPALARKGDVIWFAGVVLLGVAALLGWVGYTFATDVRVWRIILAIVGLALAVVAWVIRPKRYQ